jgi:heme-degrading monooxygenase HmoA
LSIILDEGLRLRWQPYHKRLFAKRDGTTFIKLENLAKVLEHKKGGENMIRVMIERYCQPGKEKQLRDMMLELRSAAMRQPGYLTGETLREVENPSLFMVISTWITLEAWKVWQTSRQRLLIEEMMEPLIKESRKVRVFTEDYD